MERKPSSKSNRAGESSIDPSQKKANEDKQREENQERKQKLNFYQQSEEEGSDDNNHVNIVESDQINDSDDIIF